jgi:hypothetical protein
VQAAFHPERRRVEAGANKSRMPVCFARGTHLIGTNPAEELNRNAGSKSVARIPPDLAAAERVLARQAALRLRVIPMPRR